MHSAVDHRLVAEDAATHRRPSPPLPGSGCRVWMLALLVIAGLMASEGAGEFSLRPVIPLDAAQTARLRHLIATDGEAAALAAQVVQEAAPLVGIAPMPLAEIRYEGLVNTDPRRLADVEHLRTIDQVAAAVDAWQASGEERFAVMLRRHCTAWAATYRPTGNDVNENKLTPLLVAWMGIRAATPDAKVDAWVADLGERHARAVTESQHLTNRYTKHVRLAVYCGLAIDRPDLVALGRSGIERFVAASLRADGTSLDLERRDSLTYHCSALVPVLDLALIMGADGLALYRWTAPEAGSLKRSVDFVVPYATGEKTREEWRNSTVDLDRQRAEAGLEHYRPGRLFEPAQAAKLIEAACAFDPGLEPLALRLASSPARRFGSWRMLVQQVMNAR